jgi:hypothetical protein
MALTQVFAEPVVTPSSVGKQAPIRVGRWVNLLAQDNIFINALGPILSKLTLGPPLT